MRQLSQEKQQHEEVQKILRNDKYSDWWLQYLWPKSQLLQEVTVIKWISIHLLLCSYKKLSGNACNSWNITKKKFSAWLKWKSCTCGRIKLRLNLTEAHVQRTSTEDTAALKTWKITGELFVEEWGHHVASSSSSADNQHHHLFILTNQLLILRAFIHTLLTFLKFRSLVAIRFHGDLVYVGRLDSRGDHSSFPVFQGLSIIFLIKLKNRPSGYYCNHDDKASLTLPQ